MSRDEVLDALDELVEVLYERSPRERIAARADVIREYRAAGHRYCDIEAGQFSPLVVEMIGDHIRELVDVSGRLRRAEATALYAEGMTMEQIAETFGVSRQRISQLLSDG